MVQRIEELKEIVKCALEEMYGLKQIDSKPLRYENSCTVAAE